MPRLTASVILVALFIMTLNFSIRAAEMPVARPTTWAPSERAGFPNGSVAQYYLPVHLNPKNPTEGDFDLYYFVNQEGDIAGQKTVLFCVGGPGEVVWPGDQNIAGFLAQNEYRVVYFHLRGSGYSQIPPANNFDKYLRTSYAVDDIEEIRKAVLGNEREWDAIIGLSYGTVLAQRYAKQYGKVKKLILIGALSRHQFSDEAFNNFEKENQKTDQELLEKIDNLQERSELLETRFAGNVFDSYSKEFQAVHRNTLEKIYTSDEVLKALITDEERNKILDELFGKPSAPAESGLFEQAEKEFGSLQFLIDNYCSLEMKEPLNKFSRSFFQTLRRLRMTGFFPPEEPASAGRVIAREILTDQKAKDDCPNQNAGKSDRVFDVMGVYDGINPRFLREWIGEGKEDIRAAISKSAGDAHLRSGKTLNKRIEKIGLKVSTERIKAWNPAEYKHQIPTLVLKGGADPVTVTTRQSDYIFDDALDGARVLIEVPGMGHEYKFPPLQHDEIPKASAILSGSLRLESLEIPAGEIRQVRANINGRKLNEKFKMSLEPAHHPDEIYKGLELLGFAILDDDKIEGDNKGIDNIIALFKRTDAGTPASVANEWILKGSSFSGLVPFQFKKNLLALAPGEIVEAIGRITAGERNRRFTLERPDPLDSIKPVCFRVEDDGTTTTVNILLENTGNETKTIKRTKWTISKGSEKRDFLLTPKSDPEEPELALNRQKAFPVNSRVYDLAVDRDEELKITAPAGLPKALKSSCIPTENLSDTQIMSTSLDKSPWSFPIALWNSSDDTDLVIEPATWEISNLLYTISLEVPAASRVMRQSAEIIKGKVGSARFNKQLDVRPTDSQDSSLVLLGFNILAEDQIALMLRNQGRTTVNAGGTHWTYSILGESQEKACNPSDRFYQHCLLYTFMVMEPAEFDKAEILQEMRRFYKKHGLEFSWKSRG